MSVSSVASDFPRPVQQSGLHPTSLSDRRNVGEPSGSVRNSLVPVDLPLLMKLLAQGATFERYQLPAATFGISHGHAAILIRLNGKNMLLGVFPQDFPPRAVALNDTNPVGTAAKGKLVESVTVPLSNGKRLVDGVSQLLSVYTGRNASPYYWGNTCHTFADNLMRAARLANDQPLQDYLFKKQ